MFDGEPREIVGVMPAASTLPLSGDCWVPLKFAERDLAGQRGAHYLTVVGRLRPGATVASAQNEMRLLATRMAAASSGNDRSSISVVPLARALVGTSVDAPLMLLSGAVVLVFLVACVNVAGLALGASIGRRRDLAVRAALGASRARLARGLLLESTLLATTGGAIGTALAILGTRLIATLRQVTIARLDETRVDAQVLAFAAGLTILAVVLFGVLPAWQAARRGVSSELAAASTRSTLDVARIRLRSVLVATEIGLAAALLVGGGLLARSFLSLARVPLGFDTRFAETCSISLPPATYATPERRAAFMDDLLARVSARSDVDAAGAIFGLPLSDFNYSIIAFERDGIRTTSDDQPRLRLQVRVVSPSYFRAMEIPILRGRAIDGRDRPGAPPIAVVNAAAATLLWPDADAVTVFSVISAIALVASWLPARRAAHVDPTTALRTD
jgi:predicted permease